jgi:hypothetical protein
VSPQLSIKLNKTITAGISSSFSNTTYDKDVQNSNTSVSGGPFLKAQFTTNLSLDVQGGYIVTDYSHGGTNGDSQNVNSFYGSVGVNHQINEALTESLTGGRDFLPGLSSNFTQRTYVDYSIIFQATKYLNFSSDLSYDRTGFKAV